MLCKAGHILKHFSTNTIECTVGRAIDGGDFIDFHIGSMFFSVVSIVFTPGGKASIAMFAVHLCFSH